MKVNMKQHIFDIACNFRYQAMLIFDYLLSLVWGIFYYIVINLDGKKV